jgi:hypothetical protein
VALPHDILQVELSWMGKGMGILNRLWAVRPPGKSWAAMPVDATQSTIFPSDLSRSHNVYTGRSFLYPQDH